MEYTGKDYKMKAGLLYYLSNKFFKKFKKAEPYSYIMEQLSELIDV